MEVNILTLDDQLWKKRKKGKKDGRKEERKGDKECPEESQSPSSRGSFQPRNRLFVSLLAFYCCVANYPTIRSLSPHKFLSAQFLHVRSLGAG